LAGMNRKNIRIGTSGFSYADWKGTFYPPDIKPNDMFRFYSGRFNTLELNVTYYNIPSLSTFEKFAAQSPHGFDFIIKLHRQSTHLRDALPGMLTELTAHIAPLVEAGLFGGFLAQFPYSFHNGQKNRAYMAALAGQLAPNRLFVEFRHASWAKPAVRDFIKSLNLGYVNVDEPALKGLLPMQDWLTADDGYFRFHGRNKDDWWNGNGSARYKYTYVAAELRNWLEGIKDLSAKTVKTYAFFNNHPGGGAPINASMLKQLLKK